MLRKVVMELFESWTNEDGARRATALFHNRFGHEPESVWAAPGRVNIIGEHTDYNEGFCLPIALPHRTFVAYGPREDGVVNMASGSRSEWSGKREDVGPGMAKSWANYAAGPAWSLGVEHGFEAAFESCVPVGAGLSSSAAIECSIASALQPPTTDDDRHAIVRACVNAENEVAGAPTGGMDQTISMFGQDGHALLIDTRDWTLKQIPLDLAAHGLEILVIDTRASHSLGDGQYAKRRAACEDACRELGVSSLRPVAEEDLAALSGELLRRARHVVTENQRVLDTVALLEAGRLEEIGPLLSASHASLRDDYEVTVAELDVACEAAEAAGAFGARMTGGGFGGSAIALIRSDQREVVIDAVEKAYTEHGFGAPHFLAATPAVRAERIV
ncbi:galactokinase [Trueperella pecoris]|uniref:Galactokinase n=2 Tax=Trueperella pecoris TaxID=2733571 RepID=A0A7M1QUJ6_9ACTO|nr:galactokinase [Trueperella pecoris]